MKRILARSAFGAIAIAVSVATVFAATRARANDDSGKKNHLDQCFVTHGGVVIETGNTCSDGGEGCRSNPCD